jgi:uncharacterized membrane protein
VDSRRAESFSDGVFAVAITILVFNLLPIADKTANSLTVAGRPGHPGLVHYWPAYLAYVVSFLTIGIMWVNHHTIFTHLRTIDRAFFYWNLLLLLTIVFIPYPTEVFGEALQKGEGAETAAVFYSLTMTVNACVWSGLWLSASLGRRLLNPDFPEAQRTIATILFVAGVFVYAGSIGLAFVNPYLCLGFHGAMAVYYALDPISRRVTQQRAG